MMEQNSVLEQLKATGLTLEQIIAAGKAASDLHKAEVAKAVEGEKAQRQTVQDDIEDMVKDMALDWEALEYTFTAKRTETGLDDGSLVAKCPDSLMNDIWEVIRVAGASDLKSLKRLEVTFKAGQKGTAVLHTSGSPRVAGTGTGTPGKGWIKDGGSIEKLDDVFAQFATSTEKIAYEEAVKAKDGNKAYGVKIKVAKAAGYKLNK